MLVVLLLLRRRQGAAIVMSEGSLVLVPWVEGPGHWRGGRGREVWVCVWVRVRVRVWVWLLEVFVRLLRGRGAGEVAWGVVWPLCVCVCVEDRWMDDMQGREERGGEGGILLRCSRARQGGDMFVEVVRGHEPGQVRGGGYARCWSW